MAVALASTGVAAVASAMPPDATDPVAVIVLVDDEGNDRYWGWFKILENNATGQGNVKLGTRDLELFLPPTVVCITFIPSYADVLYIFWNNLLIWLLTFLCSHFPQHT